MAAVRPVCSMKRTAACTLGPIDPDAKSRARKSSGVTSPSRRSSGVRHPS